VVHVGVIRPLDAVGEQNIFFQIALKSGIFLKNHSFQTVLYINRKPVLLFAGKQDINERNMRRKGQT
jgi:hypothetical protein